MPNLQKMFQALLAHVNVTSDKLKPNVSNFLNNLIHMIFSWPE